MSCHKQQICDKQMDDTQMDGGLCCILHYICEGGIINQIISRFTSMHII